MQTIYGWEQPSQQSGLKDISRAPEQHMQLPEDLMQQYSELEGLWGQLEQHTQHYKELSQIVDGLSGSDIHPHAIDAVKLRQYGQLTPAPNAAGTADNRCTMSAAHALGWHVRNMSHLQHLQPTLLASAEAWIASSGQGSTDVSALSVSCFLQVLTLLP